MIVKNSEFKNNSRTSLTNRFFQVYSQYQKNPEQFKNFKDWAPWSSIYGITCILPVIVFHPPTKGSPSYFENVTSVTKWQKTFLGLKLSLQAFTMAFYIKKLSFQVNSKVTPATLEHITMFKQQQLFCVQGVSQEGKKICNFHELGNKA